MRLAETFAELAGKRVLVTGATGFIGGRLVERLRLESEARPRVLVRNLAAAARLARFDLELVRGDLMDRSALAAAFEGCEVVFHCAYGTSGSQRHRSGINRLGTERVLEAAAKARVSRLVHLSTLMVYGKTADGELREDCPRRRFGNAYSDSKLDAERAVMAAAKKGRVAATVLQPTAVYGPYGGVWTEQVLGQLKSGRTIMVQGGTGLANHVYVDDLVSAMVLAAVRPEAVGEAFLVSAAEPATWKEFLSRFERMLGVERTVTKSAEEARAHWRAAQRARPRALGQLLAAVKSDRVLRQSLLDSREVLPLRELASNLLPERWQQRLKRGLGMGQAAHVPRPETPPELPIHPLSPLMIEFFSTRTRVSIDKARRLLGYEPAFDLDSGMKLTEAWARWAGLL